MIFLLFFSLCFASSPKIKIGLGDFEALKISSKDAIHFLSYTKSVDRLPPGEYDVKVSKSGKRIRVGRKYFPGNIKLESKESIYVNGKGYRDKIHIILVNKLFRVINEIDIEKYLYGVVPREMPWNWEFEALKAQAVIARTYALRNIGKHFEDGFDMCNKICCQVYGGLNSEKHTTNKAVDDTRGIVVKYQGKFANTYYHSCCGGLTASPDEVWDEGMRIPYLSVSKCEDCAIYPGYRWTKQINMDLILNTLNKFGHGEKVIKSIKLGKITPSGRTNYFIINDKIRINANAFRVKLDPFLLRSTKITKVEKLKDAFEFSGYGFGHGVGLCQWGAQGLAKRDKSFEEIIKFYYQGVDIIKIY